MEYAVLIVDGIKTQPLRFQSDRDELDELNTELEAYNKAYTVEKDVNGRLEISWLISLVEQQIMLVKSRSN